MSDPVNNGRDALDHWFGYPWYDAKTDSVKRVEVREPWNPNWNWSTNWSSGIGTILQGVAWTAVVLLLAGVAYLVIRAYVQRERRKARGDEAEQAGGADRVESLPLPVDARHLDLLAEAKRSREQGDYGRAIIFLFSHQLLQLDKHGRIHLARGKTNRQYLREMRPWPSLGELVEHTTLVFEDVFFGHHTLERPAFEACWSRLDEFNKLVEIG
jgi:hypothetical protein